MKGKIEKGKRAKRVIVKKKKGETLKKTDEDANLVKKRSMIKIS